MNVQVLIVQLAVLARYVLGEVTVAELNAMRRLTAWNNQISDMSLLKLNKNLKKKAGNYVKSCKKRKAQKGVNNALLEFFSDKEPVSEWMVEQSNLYDHDSNKCNDGGPSEKHLCHEYLQSIWAKTTDVGCASKQCDNHGAIYDVCVFSPAMEDGKKPYHSGKPCSKCPDDLPKCCGCMCAAECDNTFQEGCDPSSPLHIESKDHDYFLNVDENDYYDNPSGNDNKRQPVNDDEQFQPLNHDNQQSNKNQQPPKEDRASSGEHLQSRRTPTLLMCVLSLFVVHRKWV